MQTSKSCKHLQTETLTYKRAEEWTGPPSGQGARGRAGTRNRRGLLNSRRISYPLCNQPLRGRTKAREREKVIRAADDRLPISTRGGNGTGTRSGILEAPLLCRRLLIQECCHRLPQLGREEIEAQNRQKY
ncbi:hypothetical protein PoB_000824100 [Plakobranchus ocellatus]|uniref:Uncharacterized protein n=1 Tax=Plakobranchus ocellatus TaxID=259542 RepID=A0AAV3YEW9_9GAST|nr:hypothetical protein PoB_000824100 [Plakobranchus ocellatus]